MSLLFSKLTQIHRFLPVHTKPLCTHLYCSVFKVLRIYRKELSKVASKSKIARKFLKKWEDPCVVDYNMCWQQRALWTFIMNFLYKMKNESQVEIKLCSLWLVKRCCGLQREYVEVAWYPLSWITFLNDS